MTQTVPVKLTLRHAGHRAGIVEEIDRGTKRLAELKARITHCEILLESPGRHHRQGGTWRVRIEVGIPGAELVVDQKRAEDPYSAVHQAFARTARRIEDTRSKRVAQRVRRSRA